jgi:hypothetical protein
VTPASRAFDLPVFRRVQIPVSEAPRLHVVIDTEEEFDWHAPFARENTRVRAMRHVDRIQRIFDRFGIVPTYASDYPVVTQPEGAEPLAQIAAAGRCEIGAHLHPWVNPPFDEPLLPENSFTGNLHPELQAAKIGVLSDAIWSAFGIRPRLFKAGRYGLGRATVGILDEKGFEIDASVCPRFDFSAESGPSFAAMDSSPYLLTSRLIEIPCTVDYLGWSGRLRPQIHRLISRPWLERARAVGLAARAGVTNRIMVSPEGSTFEEMRDLTLALINRGLRIITLSFHSPSVDVGHTPYVRTRQDLQRFLRTVEQYCEFFLTTAGGRPITSTHALSWIQSFVEPNA